MNNSEKTIQYLVDNPATVTDIAEHLGISRQAVHRMLNSLVASGSVTKAGRPPKVYYSASKQNVSDAQTPPAAPLVDSRTINIIDENFLFITPFGQKMVGWDGFTYWCRERKQDVTRMSKLYAQTTTKYNRLKKDGLVDGMKKLKSTFADVALDKVFYLDFYNIEIFGKTKLGQLLLFAKQSQDTALMNQLIDSIKPSVISVIKKFDIDGAAFVPPTVKREHQLMKQLQKRLGLGVRTVNLVKIKTPVAVPQKTLSKLGDRIINARETVVVDDNSQYRNILILDDAIGSGSTLNEVAKKIRQKGMCSGKVVGLAITGSSNGFDVISEV